MFESIFKGKSTLVRLMIIKSMLNKQKAAKKDNKAKEPERNQ